MGIRDRITATREIRAADHQLAAAARAATTDTDPTWIAANQRVTDALDNPHTPRRYQDPADR